MNMPLSDCFEMELVLSFNSPSEELLETFCDPSIKAALADPEPWESDLREWIQFICRHDSLSCNQVIRKTKCLSMGLHFTDDATIADLNTSWRQKPEATDVLSFPVLDANMLSIGEECVELGDIVISLTRAQSQAEQHNHDFLHELRWLLSHGLLHLLGWEHPNSKSLKEMLFFQQQLLNINGNVQPIWINNE